MIKGCNLFVTDRQTEREKDRQTDRQTERGFEMERKGENGLKIKAKTMKNKRKNIKIGNWLCGRLLQERSVVQIWSIEFLNKRCFNLL